MAAYGQLGERVARLPWLIRLLGPEKAVRLGVLLIGTVNLMVSFSLALWVALRSRAVEAGSAAALVPVLWRWLRVNPLAFIIPPRNED